MPSKSINTGLSSVCTLSSVSMSSATHIKARCKLYPGSNTQRFPVPDDKVSWETPWPEYSPVNYTAPPVLNKPAWADPDIGWVSEWVSPFKWNVIDISATNGAIYLSVLFLQGLTLLTGLWIGGAMKEITSSRMVIRCKTSMSFLLRFYTRFLSFSPSCLRLHFLLNLFQ